MGAYVCCGPSKININKIGQSIFNIIMSNYVSEVYIKNVSFAEFMVSMVIIA